MLSKMLLLATQEHHGQFDKAGKPYILHCLKVMHYLKTDDEELMCIALGHDLMEDTNIDYQYLLENFNERIANGIRAMSRVGGNFDPHGYEKYKQKVFANRDAMLVKLCDLRHNSDIRRLKGVTEKDIARTAKYHQFYTEIKEKLNETCVS